MIMATVLYIDDDDDDRFLFVECLAKVRPEVKCVTAVGGEESLCILKTLDEQPICVFIDMNMPLVDGLQTLSLLKVHARMYHVPAYIFSTSSRADFAVEAYKLGAAAYVIKPNTLDKFCEVLTKYIPLHRS